MADRAADDNEYLRASEEGDDDHVPYDKLVDSPTDAAHAPTKTRGRPCPCVQGGKAFEGQEGRKMRGERENRF